MPRRRSLNSSAFIGWSALAGSITLVLACAGDKFGPDSGCADGDCGSLPGHGGELGFGGKVGSGGKVASEGGAIAAGAPGGGTPSNGGSSSGRGGAAGIAGVMDSGGIPGISGTGGSGQTPADFPATDVLDDFNREAPALGLSWVGDTDDYSIKEQMLFCASCGSAALWSAPFGPNQEVFAKLAHFDADAAEINLVLKAQSSPDCDLIELLYSPNEAAVRIAYCTQGVWTDLEATPLDLNAGDQLGGRAFADGLIEIYVNQQLLTSVDASGFPFSEGRLGVNGISGANGNMWDDFGGGDFQ